MTNDIKTEVTDNNEISINDIIIPLWKNKMLIIIVAAIFSVGSIIHVLVVDEKFEVSCVINPAEPSDEVMLGNASSFGGFSLTELVETPVGKNLRITLSANTFLKIFYDKYNNNEKLFKDTFQGIETSDLPKRLKEETKLETGLKILKEVINYKMNPKDGTIQISVILTDKYFAYDLLIDVLAELKRYIRDKNLKILENDIEFYDKMKLKITDPNVKKRIANIISEKIEKSSILTSNIFSITEEPRIPVKRFSPRRKIVVIIFSFLGLFIGILSVFLKLIIKDIYTILKNSE